MINNKYTLPAGWKWDTEIRDFNSLMNNLNRFYDSTGKKMSIGMYSLLGRIEEGRKVHAGDPQKQNKNGLSANSLDTFKMYAQSYYYTMHELFIKQRMFLSHHIALKTVPEYPMSYLDVLLKNPGSMTHWIESLPWENPWATGNLDMDVAFALVFEWKVMGNERARETLEVWFEWHNKNSDPATGFWDPHHTGNVARAMAGGMHQFAIYFICGRTVPNPEQAVLSTLSLQQDHGLFSPPDAYSHHGLDMDSCYVLANMYNRYHVHESKIKEAFEKVIPGNLTCFLPEGGAISCPGKNETPDDWNNWCRTAIIAWAAPIIGSKEYAAPWEFVNRNPFLSQYGGKNIPDPSTDAWYDAIDWPRPAKR